MADYIRRGLLANEESGGGGGGGDVPDFSTASWADIQSYINENGTSGFADQIGKTRSITLSDSTTHTLRLINATGNLYELTDGSGYTGFVVEFADIPTNDTFSAAQVVNIVNSYIGTYLTKILELLPLDLRNVIAQVQDRQSNTTVSMFIPHQYDIVTPNTSGGFAYTPIYQYYQTNTNHVKLLNGEALPWWFVGRHSFFNYYWWRYVDANGTVAQFNNRSGSGGGETYYMSPFFCLAPQSAPTPTPTSFADDDWETIKYAVDNNLAAAVYNVGDTKSIELTDGTTHTLRLANVDGNLYELSDGSGYTGFVVEFADCVQSGRYSQSNSCVGTLSDSNPMGTTVLPSIKAMLPSELQNVLATVKVVKANSGSDTTLVSSDMDLFIPAEKEVFGSSNLWGTTEEASALTWWAYYEVHNANSAHIKRASDVARQWWLRSPVLDRTNALVIVIENGTRTSYQTSNQSYVSPCFCLAPQSTSRLPSGYTEVEYIESTGTQYIDTGLANAFSNYIQVQAKGMFPNYNSSEQYLSGAVGSPYTATALLLGSSFRCYERDITTGNVWMTLPLDTSGNNTIEYVDICDGYEQTATANGTSKSATISGNFYSLSPYLFCRNVNNSPNHLTSVRLYYYTIWNTKDADPVRNFVPCIRESDGAVGLYDLCESASPFDGTPFYGNAGSGVFISGDPV